METGTRDERRRSFIKAVMAGSAVLAGILSTRDRAEAARGNGEARRPQEVLYRETEEFRNYYEMLRS